MCGVTAVPEAVVCQVPTSTPTEEPECLCDPTDVPILPTEFEPGPTATLKVPTRMPPTVVPSATPEPTNLPPTDQPTPEPTECIDDDDDHDDDDDCDNDD